MKSPSEIEKEVLDFWERKRIFDKLMKQRKGAPIFNFYDGPPFATGKPHYGHILVTTIKDAVLRYWTMKGYQVPRRVGWDCHGLPVENLIEKELGIKSKNEIEKMGIKKFNKACRNVVFRRVSDFEIVLKRVGRWADYNNSYATLDNDYIESVWWVFSRLWKLGLVYEEYKITPFCPRCVTPISNFEVNQGYKDVKDNSIYIKFRIKDGDMAESYLLVWTTTPWTLLSNVALAVNPKACYFQVRNGEDFLILGKERLSVLKGDYEIVKEISGETLIGIRYEPPFPYLKDVKGSENAFKILPGSFVSTNDGTGVVHTSVMYGEDDFQLGKNFDLPMIHTVNQTGHFIEGMGEFSGKFVKSAEEDIINNLKKKNLLYGAEKEEHSYPFCWRCDTFLLYYAIKTWYINVSSLKKELVANNKKIRWVPGHIKEGRFGNWLKGVKDWSFSRNRFWGAPIPIWRCGKCGEVRCIESVKQLPKGLKDLHRPYIDQVKLDCRCGGKMERIEEIFDCWFESGVMPYASWHYPFKNKKKVEATFPADFIAEGPDQTRGWFYTLHVLATILTLKDIGLGKNQPAFKNVIVNGLILDSEGKKLSKRLKNYPETSEIFDQYGADSLRYFLLSSTPIGEDYLFSAKGVEDIWRRVISTLWNSYLFFETHRDLDFKSKKSFKISDDLNKWILSRTSGINKEVSGYMDQYELTKATRPFEGLIDDLSNWYIRRSRRRFQRPENAQEKEEASQTLYRALFDLTKMIAPFTPFLTEHIYRELAKLQESKVEESVHLCDYPNHDPKMINQALERRMKAVRLITASALAQRSKAGIKVRQPLALLKIKGEGLKKNDPLIDLIKDEVNVKKVEIHPEMIDETDLKTELTDALREEGFIREVIRNIQDERKFRKMTKNDKIEILFSGPDLLKELISRWTETILSETLAREVNFTSKIDDFKEVKFGNDTGWIGIKRSR